MGPALFPLDPFHSSNVDNDEVALADFSDVPAGKALTWDQGTEMASHLDITRDTGIKVYFCDPASPGQRGTNENTNGLPPAVLPQVHRPVHITGPKTCCASKMSSITVPESP